MATAQHHYFATVDDEPAMPTGKLLPHNPQRHHSPTARRHLTVQILTIEFSRPDHSRSTGQPSRTPPTRQREVSPVGHQRAQHCSSANLGRLAATATPNSWGKSSPNPPGHPKTPPTVRPGNHRSHTPSHRTAPPTAHPGSHRSQNTAPKGTPTAHPWNLGSLRTPPPNTTNGTPQESPLSITRMHPEKPTPEPHSSTHPRTPSTANQSVRTRLPTPRAGLVKPAEQ